jgi:hypothetical protein
MGTVTSRKTISVEAVKEIANGMLRDSIPEMKDGRIAVTVLIERVLMDTGNYHGYRYISPAGDDSNVGGVCDDTRRYYY